MPGPCVFSAGSALMPERLCASDELAEGCSLRVSFEDDDHAHGICLIRKSGALRAYLNRCPHQDMAMDWLPGRFLDESGQHIVCAMHGAQFRVEDGACVAGPCQGQALQSVSVSERDGAIYLIAIS